MVRRRYAAAVVALVAVTLNAADARADAPRKPNVVILVSDDVGYGEFGFQGTAGIPTPNIDSIAKQGVRFSAGYVSGPVCSPTRAGLMTGRYQTRFGHERNEPTDRNTFGLPLQEKTMADRLKALGYATLAVGKWHLGYLPQYRPTNRGFDEYYGTLGNSQYLRPKDFVDSRVGPDPAKVTRDTFYTTDAYAVRAVDWLERNKDKPFFLYLPFNAQHVPLQPPQRYLDRFQNIADETRKKFAATMSAMDDAVGKVLAKIREIGQEENTLIFFFSDNGGPTEQTTSNNGPLRGRKGTTLEGGVRIPFCVQWKGKLPAGKTYEHPVIQLDILPTVIAAAGGTVDPAWKLDGVNLLPYLTGRKSAKPHQTLYWRFGEQWAIRDGDWKLVASRLDANQAELFDLSKDIGEANDLSLREPAKVKKLTGAWKAWNAEQSPALWQPGKTSEKKAKKDHD